MLYSVEGTEIERLWPVVLPYIEKAIAKGVFPIDPDNIRVALHGENYKLFILHEDNQLRGAGILNICNEMGIKYLNIYMMSHDPYYGDEATDLRQVEEIAKALNIDYVTYFGRLGLHRRHVPEGWKLGQVFMVKEV